MDTHVRAAPRSGSPQGRGHSVQQNFTVVLLGSFCWMSLREPSTLLPGETLGPPYPGQIPRLPSDHVLCTQPPLPLDTLCSSSHPPAWTGRLLTEKTSLSPGSLSALPGVGGQASPPGAASSCAHPSGHVRAALHGNCSIISFLPVKHKL